MKVLARNNFTNDLDYIADDNPERVKECCERFDMLEDEFGVQGQDFGHSFAQNSGEYDNTNKDLSMINRIGTAYHKWYIISQLAIMDRVPIKVGTIGTQLFELNSAQGYTKTASDFNCLKELESIERLLSSYLD